MTKPERINDAFRHIYREREFTVKCFLWDYPFVQCCASVH